MNMESKRKWKGGAEKLQDKKRQVLQAEAAKCVKLTQMFAGAGGAEAGASTSAPAGDDGGGGRQMDEARGRQEEERCVAAAEFELKVRK